MGCIDPGCPPKSIHQNGSGNLYTRASPKIYTPDFVVAIVMLLRVAIVIVVVLLVVVAVVEG